MVEVRLTRSLLCTNPIESISRCAKSGQFALQVREQTVFVRNARGSGAPTMASSRTLKATFMTSCRGMFAARN